MSDSLVKLYYLDSLDRFQDRHLLAKIDVYIDDILITARGEVEEVRKIPKET